MPTYKKSTLLTNTPLSFCPGCTHGIAHKLVAECLQELGQKNNVIGVAPVGCSVFAYKFFDCDMQEAAHGRAPAVATGIADSGIDMVLGIGGAPEGVLAAAAVKCAGGDMQARLIFTTDCERERAPTMGITDPDKIYTLEEMATGDVFFAATGVTSGALLRGVRYSSGGARTHSIVMRSRSRTVRFLDSFHYFDHKPLH